MLQNRLKLHKKLEKTTANFDSEDDAVFNEIKTMISTRQLQKGDMLPSQRKLSEKLGVGRNQVMNALQKLEFYGLVKTVAKSGTMVTGIQNPSVNMMMSDILELEAPDFKSLVETRIILEENAIRFAATRRTEQDLEDLEQAHKEFVDRMLSLEPAMAEDFRFHQVLVKASHNNVLYSLVSLLVPDLIAHLNGEHICDRSEVSMLIGEHEEILEAIREKDADKALKVLKNHFRFLYAYLKK